MTGSRARIEALRAALDIVPTDLLLRGLLAEALEDEGRWSEAVVERRGLVAVSAGDPAAKVALARAFTQAGNPGAAEVVLDELEQRGEMTPDGWRLRSLLLGVEPDSWAAARERQPGIAGRDGHPADATSAGDRAEPRAVPASTDAMGRDRDELLERPKVSFADVGGMENLKEEIRLKIIYPAQHPEVYAAYGQRSGGGLLLYGPPGCGKTHLARATAGELGASFVSVGIADVLSRFIGDSERNLHAIFATARAHRPAVLFFDEMDALAAKRSDFSGADGRKIVNQFLAELDGVERANEGILVLGATNAPWHVDPAFRRPGRFDDVLFVPPPDPGARRAILQIELRGRPVGRIDLARLVAATDGFSGADLAGSVNRAAQRRLAEALRTGSILPLETADLLAAARETGPTTREWFATVRNYATYANESGVYDAVRPYL